MMIFAVKSPEGLAVTFSFPPQRTHTRTPKLLCLSIRRNLTLRELPHKHISVEEVAQFVECLITVKHVAGVPTISNTQGHWL